MQTPPLDLSQEVPQPLVLMSLRHNDALSVGSLAFVFSDHTCHLKGDFSMTLTTTTHSPQQLMAVWNRLLPNDSEGPTLISHTALRSRSSFSTSELRFRIQYTRGTLSKNPWMSISSTQFHFQHRSRATPTASSADRPGR